MGNNNQSGNTFSINQEINIIGSEVAINSKKKGVWPMLTQPTPEIADESVRILPSLLGAVPVLSGQAGSEAALALRAMATVCTSEKINVSKNIDKPGYTALYVNVLMRAMSGAQPSSASLTAGK